MSFTRMVRNLLGLPMGDLRIVTVHWVATNESPTQYFVHKDDVKQFVRAFERLHGYPGVNPHNGRPTSQASEITVATPSQGGPYWWSTPDLRRNGDIWNGVKLLHFDKVQTVWSRQVDLPEIAKIA